MSKKNCTNPLINIKLTHKKPEIKKNFKKRFDFFEIYIIAKVKTKNLIDNKEDFKETNIEFDNKEEKTKKI